MMKKRPRRRRHDHLSERAASRRRLCIEPLEPRIVLDSTVVFNEIMYHPATAPLVEGDHEWFELFNQMAVNMDISGWSIQGAVDFTFPEGTVVPGRGYLVLASNPTALAADTGFNGALGPFSGRLGNSGEELRLVTKDGRLMNSVNYGDDGDWPVGPDGSGFSLAKRDPYSSSSAADNWTTSSQLNGTPGTRNFLQPGDVISQVVVAAGATASYFVPTDGSLGMNWTTAGFDDSTWATGPTGIGFDISGGSGAEVSDGGSGAADPPPDSGGGGAAVDTTWTGAAGDTRWAVAGNWTNDVPITAGRAFINGDGTTVLIDSATTAQAGRVLIGDSTSSDATLRVTGGSLNVSGDVQRIDVGTVGHGTLELLGGTVHVSGNLYAGEGSSAANAQGTVNIFGGSLQVDSRILLGAGGNLPLTQTMNMTAGTLTADALFVADAAYDHAVVNMTGGSMVLNTLAIPTNYGEPGLDGHFQLDGGTVTVNAASTDGTQNLPSGFRLANGTPNPPNNPADVEQGTMDITGGTLLVSGDATTLVQTYVSAGVLTGYGNPAFVSYDYNVTHPGYTTIIAHMPTVGEHVTTNIATAMHNVNSTVYVRSEFDVSSVSSIDTLSLHVQYNDGFVAYLNGQEVARRNAPVSLSWNSAATASAGIVADETIDISPSISALHPGADNVLAIQGLNTSAADNTFLLLPELTATLIPPTVPAVVFNEIAPAAASGFWLEIVNQGDTPVALDGFSIATSAGAGSAYVFSGQTIGAGQQLLVSQAQLGFGAPDGDKLYFYTPGQDSLLDARSVTNRLRGLAPGHSDDWLYPNVATPGAANSFAFHDEIVINEIMYHQAPQQNPLVESDEEWIELYNRGASPVDLTGWTIQDAIDYAFPTNTIIPAGGYLVVAKHAADMQARYPSIAVVGDFSRSLSNSGDRILLVAPDKNPADDVHYYDSGDWSELADGGGSSLELRSPDADNSVAESWAASDERGKGVWQTYTIHATAVADTGPGIWNEFLFGMLNDGEVLIDDVSVIANPSGAAAQLIQNGSFQADALGAEPQKWRIIGNEHGTVVADPENAANKVLDLRATGVTDQFGNNAGTTLAGNTSVVNGSDYLITFKARWLGGSDQLNARLYLDRVGDTVYLDVPQDTGTPGQQNSTYVANVGPTYSDLANGPILPQPNQAVVVSVRAEDPDGVASMTLYWSVDGGAWSTTPMILGADGRYTGNIPGKAAGTVVQFYVQGQDNLGAVSTYPGKGANSRALYQVDDGFGTSNPIDTIRLIMLSSESNAFLDSTQAMSNEFVGATVVYNNREVFYDVGVRPKGQARARLDTLYWGSYQIHFQPDQLFRGEQSEITLDASGSGGQVAFAQDEILVKQITNHAGGGLPSYYDDLAYAIVPTSAQNGPVLLQLAGYSNGFLDESYSNGSDGTLFEYEIIYYQQQTVDGNPESLKLTEPNGVKDTPITNLGDDADKYRWNYLIKNNRDTDDYSAIIDMAQAFSLTGTSFLNAAASVIDVDQWLTTFAAANLMGIGDTYATGGHTHNVMFYVRPSDGKILLMPWDWDVAFSQSTGAGLVLNGDLGKLLASPDYKHAYYGHLQDIINTTANAAYLSQWASNYGLLVGQNFSPDVTYIQNRANSVTSQLAAAVPQVSFAITTNGGDDFSVNALSTTLAGSGWINVREIRLAGDSQPLPITWTAVDQWQVTVPLNYSANNLQLEAYDFQGALIGADTITITSTLPDPRQADALRITEIMYHPSPPPPGGAFDREEFEFIEIQNISALPINLEGAAFTVGVTFTFPATTLNAGQFVVVVEDAAAFVSRYPGPITIAGQYSGKLDNAGEMITFRAVSGQVIQSFTYGDDDWYPPTDGPGYSLVIVNPLADPTTWGLQSSWRVSTNLQGSPGQADPLYLDADVNQDGQVNIFDINLVSAHWGEAGPLGDANHDSAVNIFDINLVSASWGLLPGGGVAGSAAGGSGADGSGADGSGAGATDGGAGAVISSLETDPVVASDAVEPSTGNSPTGEPRQPRPAIGANEDLSVALATIANDWTRRRNESVDRLLASLSEETTKLSRQTQIGRFGFTRTRADEISPGSAPVETTGRHAVQSRKDALVGHDGDVKSASSNVRRRRASSDITPLPSDRAFAELAVDLNGLDGHVGSASGGKSRPRSTPFRNQ
jgi:Lamin Tail Domain/CotH kinase protein